MRRLLEVVEVVGLVLEAAGVTALDDWFAAADALLAEIDGSPRTGAPPECPRTAAHGAETGIDPEEIRTAAPSGTGVRFPAAPPDIQVC